MWLKLIDTLKLQALGSLEEQLQQQQEQHQAEVAKLEIENEKSELKYVCCGFFVWVLSDC